MSAEVFKFDLSVDDIGENGLSVFYLLIERLAQTNQFLSQQLAALSK
jgi:hypothetical protein